MQDAGTDSRLGRGEKTEKGFGSGLLRKESDKSSLQTFVDFAAHLTTHRPQCCRLSPRTVFGLHIAHRRRREISSDTTYMVHPPRSHGAPKRFAKDSGVTLCKVYS